MEPQNLLVITSDEHNPKMLGAAGHPLAKTPNLDGLAARGTRFDRAYTNCPICVPARASFATGRYVHDTEYWDNSIAYDGRVAGWGHRLQVAGIRVGSIGKLHYQAGKRSDRVRQAAYPDAHQRRRRGCCICPIRRQFPDFTPLPQKKGQWRGGDRPSTPGAAKANTTRYDRRVADLASDWVPRRREARRVLGAFSSVSSHHTIR